jgi:hypothetical protein
LDFYIDAKGVITEDRFPTRGEHSVLDVSFYRLTFFSGQNPWKSSIERGEKRRVLPSPFGISPISFDVKANENIVLFFILLYPNRVFDDGIVNNRIDYPINGIVGRSFWRSFGVRNQIAGSISLVNEGIERRIDIGRRKS